MTGAAELESIRAVMKRRDGLSDGEVDELFEQFHQEVDDGGQDPEELMQEIFGLEPDYIFDREIKLF